MLRKTSAIAFGGMWVFPGGRVDPEDAGGVDPAELVADPGAEEVAAQRAAAREAFEEADLLVVPEDLVPFSHWTPPEVAMGANKRFATWFFVCRAPVGEAGEVTVDGGEIDDHTWAAPAGVLARRDAGEIQLVPPTVVTLADLARFASVDEVLAAARARTPFRYLTRIVSAPDAMVALWQGDAGYRDDDLKAAGSRHRLTMGEGPWRFEDDVVLGLP